MVYGKTPSGIATLVQLFPNGKASEPTHITHMAATTCVCSLPWHHILCHATIRKPEPPQPVTEESKTLNPEFIASSDNRATRQESRKTTINS